MIYCLMSLLRVVARSKKATLSVIFVSITLFLSRSSYSMSCSPSPTKEYLDYLNLIRVMLYPTLFLLVLLINFIAIASFFKINKTYYAKKKLSMFVFLVTLSSFLLYALWYLVILPPNSLIDILGVDLSGAVNQIFMDRLSFLVLGLFSFNVMGTVFSFFVSRYLLTKYIDKNSTNTQNSIFLTVLMLPFVGTFIMTLLLSFFTKIIPFIGKVWGSCV